jgi:hypothetical protein
MIPNRYCAALTVLMLAVTAGCGSSPRPMDGTSTSAPGVIGPRRITDPYSPTIDPAAFSTTIDNPYMPLTPGTRTIYQADTAEGRQRTTVEVTRDIRKVMGVDTVVVHDVVTLNGKTAEDTFDWFAQDRDGNVWYLGEATKKFGDGTVDTTGSFEAGVNGALPGVVMLGRPQVGDQYRQEFARGVAEDTGEVVSLSGAETTPLTGAAKDLLVTKDSDLRDPSGVENKYYARGVGLVLTVNATGAAERDEAIVVEHF